jgi:hypothetical protein
MLVRLLFEWRKVKLMPEYQRVKWLRDHNIVRSRLQQFDGTASNLARSVGLVLAQQTKRNSKALNPSEAPQKVISDIKAFLTHLRETASSHEGSDEDDSSYEDIDDDDDYDECDCAVSADAAFAEADVEDMFGDLEGICSSMKSPLEEDLLRLKQFYPNFDEGCDPAAERERLNMCRLIIAWTSDGTILSHIAKSEEGAVETSIRVPEELCEAQCQLLFPEGVPHRLERLGGKRIFDARVSGTDCNRTVLDILSDMCLVAKNIGSERYNMDTVSHGNGWNVRRYVGASAPVLWILFPDGDHMTAVIALTEAALEYTPVFGAIFKEWQDSGENIDVYKLFCVKHVSNKQQKALNKLHDLLERSFSMLLPLKENAKLTVSKCQLSQADLSFIFFGNDSVKESAVEQARKISVQTVSFTQTISFKRDQLDMESSPYEFEHSLINDLPIGLRLFNAYRLGRYKEK